MRNGRKEMDHVWAKLLDHADYDNIQYSTLAEIDKINSRGAHLRIRPAVRG
jgi:hypothetical protein